MRNMTGLMRILKHVLVGCALLLVWNEMLVYYVVLTYCGWPSPPASDGPRLRAMFLADTHLLGPRQGHWWDKLRREWQMKRAYQTAITMFQPEAVFILGDLLDEGKWTNDAEFETDAERFKKMFRVPSGTELYLAVGNHDVGFHYDITPRKTKRFRSTFHTKAAQLITVRDSHFVVVNSMAFEGDSCQLCSRAQRELKKIKQTLDCWKKGDTEGVCSESVPSRPYSRPILLQHFPLYRENDANCVGPDSAPPDEKFSRMKPRWDCLSRNATRQLLEWLEPRLVIDGHTHHWCHTLLPGGVEELTLPSFSWRNKHNPSFLMTVVSPWGHEWAKCYMPDENSVILTYFLGLFCIALSISYSLFRLRIRNWRKVV